MIHLILNIKKENLNLMQKNILIHSILWLFLGTHALHASTTLIMPLGDSITYDNNHHDVEVKARPTGLRHAYRNHLWYKLKADNMDVNFVGSLSAGKDVRPAFDPDNEGHPGWTSYEIANHTYAYMAKYKPNIVLLHIGTNDRSTSINGVNSILTHIDQYEKDSGHKIHVYVALIIDRKLHDPIIASFNNKLKKLVDSRWKKGDILTLVNMYGGAGLNKSDYSDNTHPNDNGYAKMANVWFKAIKTPYKAYSSAPIAQNDTAKAETGAVVTLNVVSNDKDAQNDMDISTVSFVGGTDTKKDGNNDKLSVDGQGTWRVTETGVVTFTPQKGFTADPTPAKYTIKDKKGKVSNQALISIDYSNTSLNDFPTSLVDASYIESTSVDEASNSIEFITRIPDTGIQF